MHDLVCFSEHWLVQSEIDVLKIRNYCFVSYFCRKSHIHGGVAIAVKHNLLNRFVERSDLNDLSQEMHCEVCAVQAKSLKLTIITLYRPPSGNYETFLNTLELLLQKTILNQNFNTLINGDFNVDFLTDGSRTNTLIDLAKSYGFAPLISTTLAFAGAKLV